MPKTKQPGGWDVKDLSPKTRGRVVLAHISDLHADGETDFDSHPWDALQASLSREEVDLLIVTGDLVELPLRPRRTRERFEVARSFLHQLCAALDIVPDLGLLVIPGNHDVRRLRGVFSLDWRVRDWGARRIFYEIFANYLPRCRWYPNLRLSFSLFDSNPDLARDLAAGHVSSEDLTACAALLHDGPPDADRQRWIETTRIALVHHHPMPIGPTQTDEKAIVGGEPYMLLKNSGIFLQEMIDAGIRFVLHGHRHYPSLSRASFRNTAEIDESRAIDVIAAGSVGKKDDHEYSYNRLVIEREGQVAIRKYRLRNATYERDGVTVALLDGEDLRHRTIQTRLDSFPPALHVRHLSSHWQIDAMSGDAHGSWVVRAARAYSQPVSRRRYLVQSNSGYPASPSYQSETGGQSVRFEPDDGGRGGYEIFEPPLSADHPIDYVAEMRVHNAFHFNRQDLTDPDEREEGASYETRALYDNLTLSITFPEKHFPASFRAEARPISEPGVEPVADLNESRRAEERLSRIPRARTVFLRINRPLPFYTYSILWSLPESDRPAVSAEIWNQAREIRKRLLEPQRLSETLESLRDLVSKTGETNLEAALFVFRQESRGLTVVACHGDEATNDDLRDVVLKPGRTLVGQAFRRRQPMSSVSGPDGSRGERYFDAERDPETLHVGRTATFASPLLFPMDPTGVRLGVLWLGTRSRLSRLIGLREEHTVETFVKLTNAWFHGILLPALGLEALSRKVDLDQAP